MRTLLTTLLLVVAALPAQAEITDICDRTPEVRDAILKAASADDCAAVNLASVERLFLDNKQLTLLKAGDFNGLENLKYLDLHENQLTTLPVGVFDGLGGLQRLTLHSNRLTTLPEDVFDGLTNLEHLYLGLNPLTALPERVFDGLGNLKFLNLSGNRLATLPEGVFDGLDSLVFLGLVRSRLVALPEGVFDGLDSLETLDLRSNHLVGLTMDDPLFAGLAASVELSGQTELPRLVAAVPLMLSASTRQSFVRIVNESDESGVVRIFAFDDGGYAPDPIWIQLEAGQAFHFNSDDLQDGNSNKGMEGVGDPIQGDWRLDIETALSVRVLAFASTSDGFLTAMHDVLPRDDQWRLVAMTFNSGSNDRQESKLRLVNVGDGDETVSIAGVDDQGNKTGPVTLTLAAGQSRTLSASELENGAHGLTGALGEGRGKWRLFVTARGSVVAMNLLDADGGSLTNISTMGVALKN